MTAWRRAHDSEQCCGHVRAVRRVDPWPEDGLWLCRCACVRCGHVWTEIGFREPAHSDVRRSMQRYRMRHHDASA